MPITLLPSLLFAIFAVGYSPGCLYPLACMEDVEILGSEQYRSTGMHIHFGHDRTVDQCQDAVVRADGFLGVRVAL